MKWFEFRQNNSGGSFDESVGEYVFVQANSAEEANSIAETHGVYFNGCENGSDCECCGDRWDTAWGDGADELVVYNVPVDECVSSWMDKPVAVIPYGGEPRRTGRKGTYEEQRAVQMKYRGG